MTNQWSINSSAELYRVAEWGKDYFSISNRGTLQVHPEAEPSRSIDLKELIGDLRARDVELPVLLRFPQILNHRLQSVGAAFADAINEFGYTNVYTGIYPIKVNQQADVVAEYLECAREHNFGIEAGSKPELLAVMALADDEQLILCNGFKDAKFIETVVLAHKMGRKIIPIVEKFSELELIIRYAKEHGIRPRIGVRAKLATRGSGRWQTSAGEKSKFGLNTPELLRAIDLLKREGMADCLELLHFHLGSQVTDIQNVKRAITEAARLYAELKRAGAAMGIIDVGGGLGVDYDGSQSSSYSSINYSLGEYANDIVYRLKTVCDQAGIEHPRILSESGRAMIAYHSMLIMEVIGATTPERGPLPEKPAPDDPMPIQDLYDIASNCQGDDYLESYHDAAQAIEETITAFNLGYFSLEQRARAEYLFWTVCQRLRDHIRDMDRVPEDLDDLERRLASIYFCNFSLFQSMPDSWAIDQLFPIMPIHRLDEEPTVGTVLGDITCDSDGKIDKFIALEEESREVLELHPLRPGENYELGIFLLGAYQEILGDLHNLFGDTNAVHVSLDHEGRVTVDHFVEGDNVAQVLGYVQYDPRELLRHLRREAERALRENRITVQECALLVRFYQTSLNSYTYLTEQQPKPDQQATIQATAASSAELSPQEGEASHGISVAADSNA